MTSPQGPLERQQQPDKRDLRGRGRQALQATWATFGWLLVGLLFTTGALISILRYGVLPRADELRPQIEQIASRALNAPVSIRRIEASWRGFNPHLVLSDVRVTGHDGQQGIALPRVEGTLSWLTLVAFDPRFSLLRIDAPDLDVVRMPGDRVSVAGFVLNSDAGREDWSFADWVLLQGKIVITNARIRYIDRRPTAAETGFELTRVNLQLEHQLGLHVFGMQAQPTAAIAAPIDVRARFRHSPFAPPSDPTRWTGEVYGAVEYADLAAVSRLFGAPLKIERAEGAVRSWLSFDRARITRITADVALTNVNVSLADNLQPVTLTSLQGRVSRRHWGDENGSGGQEFTASRLTLVDTAQQTMAPIDLDVRTTRARAGTDSRTQVRASRIDLQNLAWIAARVPLARELREIISKHAVTGTLNEVTCSWNGAAPGAQNITLKAQFQNLSSAVRPELQSEVARPGFQNMSGSFDLANGAGTLHLASKDAVLMFPGVFAEPRLRLSTLNTALRWKSDPVLEVRVESLAAANPDMQVEASGTFRASEPGTDSEPRGRGHLDLSGRIARLYAPAAFRYVPAVVGGDTIEWLRHALVAGKFADGAFRVKGDLAKFPFGGDRTGEMRLTARIEDATLDVHPGVFAGDRIQNVGRTWPLLTGIDADLLFDRSTMTVTAKRGSAAGVRLSGVVARIADLERDATLDVRGSADGALPDMLRYVNTSPVARWIGGVTTSAEASGNARLDLQFALPLQHASDTRVKGTLQFSNNDLQFADAPALTRINGTLGFTEAVVTSTGLNATMLGGQAKIDASTRGNGTIVFGAAGIATVPALRRAMTFEPVQQLLERSQGQARYTATLTVGPSAELNIESDLVGVAIDGLAPLRKTAQDTMPLRIERTISGAGRAGDAMQGDELRITAGPAFAVRLERRFERGEYHVTRGVIALNEPANMPEAGVLVLANMPRLDVEAWSSFLGSSAQSDGGANKGPPEAMQIDLLAIRTQELVVMGRSFRNVTLGASRTANGGFDANVVSDAVAGFVAWRPEQVTARLSRLLIPAAAKSAVVEALRSPPRQLPALDVTAERFELADMKLGRLELLAQNLGAAAAPSWSIKRFDVTNADMKLSGSGEWAPAAQGAARRVQMNFKVDARDAGATLTRLGFAGAMAAGTGALEADVEWLGSPLDIDYATLRGKVALKLDNGRFLKVDTGKTARLLSLLSLQSLSRTLLFDGGRQFSEGFAYNSVRADATVAEGVMSTSNFRMAGASAAALMSGTVDLRNETQQLHLVVLPEIDASTAALALGVANPVLGLGAYLATYVLRNPLSKAFALEYDITGPWAQPSVVRLGRTSANAGPSAEAVR